MRQTFDQWDREQLHRLAVRAGQASGKARREKRRKINAAKIADAVHKEIMAEREQNLTDNLKLIRAISESTAELALKEKYIGRIQRGGRGLKVGDVIRHYEKILREHGITER